LYHEADYMSTVILGIHLVESYHAERKPKSGLL
jgi:hypothetical protein